MASSAAAASITTEFQDAPQYRGAKRSHVQMEQQSESYPLSPSGPSHPATDPFRLPTLPPRSTLMLPRLSPSIRTSHNAHGLAVPGPRSRNTSTMAPRQGPQPTSTVVDLTGDDDEQETVARSSFDYSMLRPESSPRQRLPRYSRDDIIDLSADTSPVLTRATPRRRSPEERRITWDANRRPPTLVREPSSESGAPGRLQHPRERRYHRRPEDMFTPQYSTSPYLHRSDIETARAAEAQPRPASWHRQPQPLDLTSDDDIVFLRETRPADAEPDSPVIFVGENRIPSPPHDPMSTESGFFAVLRDALHRQQSNSLALLNSLPNVAHYVQNVARYGPRIRPRVPRDDFAMDYSMAAFDLGFGLDCPPRGSRAPHKYEPPRPAADGFTRTPKAGEEVVCPACGDELTTGDTEEKRQVWVVKNCGHVYCGECMHNRKNTKGKAKARSDRPALHFSECVVDGCNSKVSNKTNVIQLFL